MLERIILNSARCANFSERKYSLWLDLAKGHKSLIGFSPRKFGGKKEQKYIFLSSSSCHLCTFLFPQGRLLTLISYFVLPLIIKLLQAMSDVFHRSHRRLFYGCFIVWLLYSNWLKLAEVCVSACASRSILDRLRRAQFDQDQSCSHQSRYKGCWWHENRKGLK